MKHLEDERGLFSATQEIHLLVALLEEGAQTHLWSLNEDHTISCFVYLNSEFLKAGLKVFHVSYSDVVTETKFSSYCLTSLCSYGGSTDKADLCLLRV